MDAAIDVKTLEEAVTVFYRSGAQQQSAAHDWLNKVQLSPQAWSFVWDLMQLGKVRRIFDLFRLKITQSTNITRAKTFLFKVVRDSIFWSHHTTYKAVEALA